MKISHPLKPIYDKDSKVLILGTMPSSKSREMGFYYAHPQNRFWKIISKVYEENIGSSNEEKEAFLHRNHIALFDVLKTCDIESSSDSTIKNPVPNDLTEILEISNIKDVFTLGKKAYNLYQKYIFPKTNITAKYLPSTSPANCPKGIEEKLYQEFMQIRNITQK